MGGGGHIEADDLQIHYREQLGSGGAGNVYKGTLRRAGSPLAVAVKVLDTVHADKSRPPRELILLQKARSKCSYVCEAYGYATKGKKTCLVLALYEKSLANMLAEMKGQGVGLADVVHIGKQLAEAISLLHASEPPPRIGHFDIKPDNILLDARGTCHLCDFSIALEYPPGQSVVNLPQDAYGSTHYMAPEQVNGRYGGVTLRADVWGVAATLLELSTGEAPFAKDREGEVLNALINGVTPRLPPGLEPRFAAILGRSFRVDPAVRQGAQQLLRSLSQLSRLLQGEGRAAVAVQRLVVTEAEGEEGPKRRTGAARARDTSASLAATLPAGSTQVRSGVEGEVTASGKSLLGLAPGGTMPGAFHTAIKGTAMPATCNTTMPEVDLLSLDTLAISPPGSWVQASNTSSAVSARASSFTSARGSSFTSAPSAPPPTTAFGIVDGAAAAGSPLNGAAHIAPGGRGGEGGSEAVVVTAGASGRLGVKCLFRSWARILANPGDEGQMTGVTLVPNGPPGAPVREAVSVSASGRMAWWDLGEGCVLGDVSLESRAGLPFGMIGRSVAVDRRFAVVGTDRSRLTVWQFERGEDGGGVGASWVAARDAAGGNAEEVRPRCVHVARLREPESSRVYDLALQPPWGSSSGGAWVACASSLGDLALWDTRTWQEMYSAKAAEGSIYSCCVMPGPPTHAVAACDTTEACSMERSTNRHGRGLRKTHRSDMVAVAGASPHLIQVWDCRQPPDSIAAVMACELDPAARQASEGDSVYCVSCVPSPSGVGAYPSQMIFGTKRGRLYVWDLRSPGALWMVAQLADKVLGCVASPCGRRVVAGARTGQVAMLDWTRPLTGHQATQAQPPYVTHWLGAQSMYVWPRMDRGIVRLASGNLVAGPLLASDGALLADSHTV